MLIPELALELSRIRIQHMNDRATLKSRLGELPAGQPLFSFRRRVVSLPGTVEIRRSTVPGEPSRTETRAA